MGDGSAGNRLSPADVPGMANMVEVGAGGYHNCVLRPNSRVSCWGYNAFGQAGNGTFDDIAPLPETVPNLANVVALANGGGHSCVLRADGGVRCWGYNASGQLGDGTSTHRATPVNVAFP